MLISMFTSALINGYANLQYTNGIVNDCTLFWVRVRVGTVDMELLLRSFSRLRTEEHFSRNIFALAHLPWRRFVLIQEGLHSLSLASYAHFHCNRIGPCYIGFRGMYEYFIGF